jgi:glucosamine--fructose-6-phosphate aminotransferase (isomerizing)
VLYLLSLWLGQRADTIAPEELRVMLDALQELPGQMQRVLDDATAGTQLTAIADQLAERSSCMFIGRGSGFPLALEGALKLKEISYVHAEAYPAGELKHGPIALLDERVPLAAMALASKTYEKVVSNIQEVRARGARVLVVATEGDTNITRHAEDVIYVPEAPEILSPLLGIVPLQLLSYHVALARGCNIDQPRNLAKSVTVE